MSENNSKIVKGFSVVEYLDEQMSANPHYPFNLQSGWLPEPGSESLKIFLKKIMEAPPQPWAPCIQTMDDLLTQNDVLGFLMDSACGENTNVLAISEQDDEEYTIPRIASKDDFLNTLNTLLIQAPQFINYDLVGLPFSAYVVGIDPTLSGRTLFGLPQFNEAMKGILNTWSSYLSSPASNTIFSVEGQDWLSDTAKQHYQFGMWKKDNETLPYWNSWDSFFTRIFKEPEVARPVAEKDNNQIVVSANDGSLFRWEDDLSKKDVFWFKDMQYSLSDIFSSLDEGQQKIMDEHNLTEIFKGGSLFQTYLNP